MNENVVVGYIHPGIVEEAWAHSMMNMLMAERRIVSIISMSSSMTEDARQGVVSSFLSEVPGADWLWFTDTDMVWEDLHILDKLFEVADPETHPIVGGLAFIWNPKKPPTVRPSILLPKTEGPRLRPITRYPKDAVIEVGATGTFCLLIHRKVLEAMRDHYDEDPYPWFNHTFLGNNLWTDVIGTDVTFCQRARALGFPIHINTAAKMGHLKRHMIDESVFEAYIGTSADDGEEEMEWRLGFDE